MPVTRDDLTVARANALAFDEVENRVQQLLNHRWSQHVEVCKLLLSRDIEVGGIDEQFPSQAILSRIGQ
jgi:hypothetical protein